MAGVFVHLPPFISQILDFINSMVLIFILIYFEWRDTENQQYIRFPQPLPFTQIKDGKTVRFRLRAASYLTGKGGGGVVMKSYTPSRPSEIAAEFQGFATPSHLKVYSHLHHNWSLWERVPHGSGDAAIYHAKFYHSYPIPRCNSHSAIGQGQSDIYRWPSSAYILGTEWDRQLGKSLIYSKHSRGPNIVPWGIPHLTVQHSEREPLTTHFWVRLSRYEENNLW